MMSIIEILRWKWAVVKQNEEKHHIVFPKCWTIKNIAKYYLLNRFWFASIEWRWVNLTTKASLREIIQIIWNFYRWIFSQTQRNYPIWKQQRRIKLHIKTTITLGKIILIFEFVSFHFSERQVGKSMPMQIKSLILHACIQESLLLKARSVRAKIMSTLLIKLPV